MLPLPTFYSLVRGRGRFAVARVLGVRESDDRIQNATEHDRPEYESHERGARVGFVVVGHGRIGAGD